MTIELPAGRDCATSGAICTKGEKRRQLTNSPSATVAGPPKAPLTANFENVPASHDGENAFTFRLTFSEDVDSLSFQTLRDEALEVTGGEVLKAKRRTKGSNQEWDITVEPDSGGSVTIRLPRTTDCDASGAICTADHRPLSTALSATVAGP